MSKYEFVNCIIYVVLGSFWVVQKGNYYFLGSSFFRDGVYFQINGEGFLKEFCVKQ